MFPGQAQNEYHWDAICEVLDIQLDSVDARGSHSHRRAQGKRFKWNSAFEAEVDDYEEQGDDKEEQYEDEYEEDGELDRLTADVEKLESAMAVIDVNDMSEEEIQ
eukprot:6329219-Pyramimonas_sp.AAC.1